MIQKFVSCFWRHNFTFYHYVSASNTVWCVDSVLIGTTYYVMVFNGGESESTIDNVDVFRYACFVSERYLVLDPVV